MHTISVPDNIAMMCASRSVLRRAVSDEVVGDRVVLLWLLLWLLLWRHVCVMWRFGRGVRHGWCKKGTRQRELYDTCTRMDGMREEITHQLACVVSRDVM